MEATIQVTTGRPPTLNTTLGGARWRYVKQEWRKAGKAACEAVDPTLRFAAPVTIDAQVLTSGGNQQDVGAAAPAVKAVVDGVVDAGWLADDDPTVVRSLNFLPHRRGSHNGLTLTIREMS